MGGNRLSQVQVQVVILLTLIVFLAGAGWLLGASPPVALMAQGTTPTPTAAPPFGVQTFNDLNNPVVVTRTQDAGILWIRYDVHWGAVEPNPPVDGVHTYQWSDLDKSIDRMIAAGFRPLLTVGRAPTWAVDSYQALWDADNNPATPPVQFTGGPLDADNVADFVAFASALVERYKPGGERSVQAGWPAGAGVRLWELYNEPDNQSLDYSCAVVGSAWGADLNGNGTSDSQEYANLLRQSYAAIKAADPNAQVVFGSLAYETISENCFNMNFLSQVLDYLQSNYSQDSSYPFFDLMGFHQYDFNRDAWDGQGTTSLPFNQGFLAKAVHSSGSRPSVLELLSQYGLGSIPLLGTEVGLYSPRDDQGDEWQARHLVHVMTRALSLWPDKLQAVILFTLRDANWGLLNTDDSATPFRSYYAYRRLIEELGGYRFERQLGPESASQGGTASIYIQAFRFVDPQGNRKLVLWTDPGCPIRVTNWNPCYGVSRAIVLGREQLGVSWPGVLHLRVVDSTAYPNKVETIIADGGSGDWDGEVNGSIMLDVDQDPVYISVVEGPTLYLPYLSKSGSPLHSTASSVSPYPFLSSSPTASPEPRNTPTAQPAAGRPSRPVTLAALLEPRPPLGPSNFFDRLTAHKPGVWGQKWLYVLLGISYAGIIGLFLRRVIGIASRGP